MPPHFVQLNYKLITYNIVGDISIDHILTNILIAVSSVSLYQKIIKTYREEIQLLDSPTHPESAELPGPRLRSES